MHARRRRFLELVFAFLATGCGALLRPVSAMAAEWNKKGFEARGMADVLRSFNAGVPAASKNIQLKFPEIADDDADVPVFVASSIPNTQMIAIMVENNVHPLAASFVFSTGVNSSFSAHLRVGRTSAIKAVVRADGKYFLTSKEVKVTTGDCAK